MRAVQIVHGEFDFQELCIETHPGDLCDGFIVQFKHSMITFHFEVVAVVGVLRELQTTQYKLLRKIDDNRYILLGNGWRINDPRTLNGHGELMGEIWRLNDAAQCCQCATALHGCRCHYIFVTMCRWHQCRGRCLRRRRRWQCCRCEEHFFGTSGSHNSQNIAKPRQWYHRQCRCVDAISRKYRNCEAHQTN